ncbi:MAG: RagB/SusD family nutrient uptake outer membrane protein [Odoribacter sp.]|nr:RagB/SusD family nutrient uptake outer membrane protein [Odoribacter sp.]
MKKLLSILSIVALAGIFTGCDKYLDLEPSQNISENIALTTDENVKNVLIGAYSQFDNPGIYGGGILRNSELLGGNTEIQWVGTYIDPRQIFNKTMIASNSEAAVHWSNSYSVINTANNILGALDVVKAADRDRIQGESLFLRSLMYFDLVRFFAGQYNFGAANTQFGVPLILTPTRGINESSFVTRNTVDEIYNQVIADLILAASKLPAGNGVYATKGAANALLARVYLQKGAYANARDAANTVITSALYTLKTAYADVFNNDNNSSEDIFATQITPQDRSSAMTEFFSVPIYGGRDGDIDILPAHMALYPPGDARADLFFTGNGALRTGKWNNQYGVVNLIRLAEMYLIRAECNIRLSTTIGATPLADYNTIHTRAGLAAAGSVVLDDILLERRLELAFEGFKIHDVKRLHLNVGALPYNDAKLLFPIPARELDANPNLKTQQNPGY